MPVMQLRHKFGPRLDGLKLIRPLVAGELPDVEVSATVADVKADAPGFVEVDVAFAVPAYDPAAFNVLDSVAVVFVAAGQPEPTDPDAALNAAMPKGSADTSGHLAGGSVVVTVAGVPEGKVTGLTVLSFQVTAAAAPAPSTPLAPALPGPLDPATTG